MNTTIVDKSSSFLIAIVAILLVGGIVAGSPVVHADGEYDDFGFSSYGGDFGYSASSYDDFGTSWSGYDDFGLSSSAYNDFGTSASSYDDFGYAQSAYNDFGSSWSGYNDFGYSTSAYDDFGQSASAYDDFGLSASAYNDFGTSASAYDDFGYSTSAYDDFGYSQSAYDDFGYSQSAYDDFGHSSSMYDDKLWSRSYYDDVLLSRPVYADDTLVSRPVGTMTSQPGSTVGGTSTVYSSACNCIVPSYSAPVQQQQVYSQACQCYQTIPSYAPASFAQAYMPVGMQQYAPLIQHPIAQYPSYPSYPQHPIPQPPRPQPQQPSNFTSNYCTGGSCNTSIVDNSINGSFNDYSINHSFNTAPVVPVTPQPIISYQIPTHVQGAYCVISASPTSISNGQAAILTWSSNGTSAWLSDGIGSVAANGSLAVRPNTTRTYVLTVNGIYGSNTCSVTINVVGTAPYVSLSQIPYTGFDLGVIGNTIYWMGLAGLALALSYLVLYFKGGAVAFAGSMFSRPVALAHSTPEHDDHTDHADHAPAPVAHAAFETQEQHAMKDTMTITRSADGTPRIVINRA